MITRKLTADQYQRLYQGLIQKARSQPLSPAYEVDMVVNGVEYTLKVQPERHHKMAVLHALRVSRDEEEGQDFHLVTKGIVLASLLELLIHQWAA